MKHPRTFRVWYNGSGSMPVDYVATEIRADEHWISLLDDSGNKLHLIKSDRVKQVELITEEGNQNE